MRCSGKFFIFCLVLFSFNTTLAVTISTINGSYTDMWIFDDTTLIVVGDGGRIIKSSDGGNTWIQQSCPTVNTLNSVCFTDRENGWIVGNSTILKTENGGNNWVDCGVGKKIGNLKSLYFVNKDVGYAGGWGEISNYDTFNNFINVDKGSVSTSINTYVNLNSLYFTDQLNGFAALRSPVGSPSKILKTVDGAKTWNPCLELGGELLGSLYEFTSVQFIDSLKGWVTGYDLMMNNAGLIVKTIDGGTNWLIQQKGSSRNSIQEIHSIFFIDSLIGWTAGKWELKRSNDGGNTWARTGFFKNRVFEKVKFYNLKTGWAVGGNCTIVKSVDGGENWESKSLGVSNDIAKICVIDSNTYFLYDGNVVKRSVNGGITWSDCDSIIYNNMFPIDMAFFNKDTGWMIANKCIWKSNDGGISFSIVDTLENSTRLCKTGASKLLILAKKGCMYRMDSNGLLEDSLETECKTIWQAAYCDLKKWWIVGDTSIVVSTNDSGKTFTYSTITVPYGSRLYLKDIKFTDDSIGFTSGLKVDGLGTQSGVIFKTVDGGKTWSQNSTLKGSGFGSIYTFGKDTLWVEGTKCYRSIDGGVSWDSASIGGRIAPLSGNKSLVYGSYGSIQLVDFTMMPVSVQFPKESSSTNKMSTISLSTMNSSCLRISFTLPYSEVVTVNILTISGKKIATLLNRNNCWKSQVINYNTASLPSGVYLISMNTGKEIISKKFSLVH